LSGKFAYKAKSMGGEKEITVSGTFKYTCAGDKCAK